MAPRRYGMSAAWLQIFRQPVAPAGWWGSLIVVALCAAYLIPMAYRGWIPHDQGILAQSAYRVLQGELPHRDFDELYTGGLSYLNALAFMLWGVKISSIRTMFLIFSLIFVWALHRIVGRLMPPGVAELTLFSALAWGLTNYFEAMPSWYNLFFIVFGLAAMLQYIDTRQTHWLLWVGGWGGASLLVKIVGLYYIAAMLLVLAVDTQLAAQRNTHRPPHARWLLPTITIGICLLWLLLVLLMTRRNADTMLLVQLVVPSIAVAVAAAAITCRHPVATWPVFRQLLRNWSIFMLGVLLPMAVFIIPYLATGALGDLYRGLLVLPFTRLTDATYAFPSGWPLLLAVAGWTAVGIAGLVNPKWDRDIALVAVAATALVLTLPYWFSRELVLLAVRMLPPAIAVIGGVMLVAKSQQLELLQQRRLFLLLTVAAFCSLSQFPFAAPIYFCFIATLYLVLLQHMVTLPKIGWPATAWVLATSGLLWGVLYINRYTFFDDPRTAQLDPPRHLLDLPRGGLRVSRRDQETYEQLTREITAHCQPQETLLATPDCPEVYFLSERDNPTRTFLEFFDRTDDTQDSTVALINQLAVKVLVINLEPRHSAKLSDETVAELVAQFEHTTSIGNFLVCFEPLPAQP